ncbi:MAG: EF-hand domain-containing protein [Candidatus Thiodiazotropha sp. (ex Cardiolucina cf. quadrata)]|nr:EF-hand domain-containing protein [Candidatus Thiodiazotropha sp. (ex Cardiolucina cf. quadrata)]
MRENKIILLISAVLLMTSLIAYALERPPGGLSFENFDTNGNGIISLKEFVEKVPDSRRSPREIFSSLDTNEDNTISQEEFDARRTRKGHRR